MSRIELVPGTTFGKFTVIGAARSNMHGRAQTRVRCVCGDESVVHSGALAAGRLHGCPSCSHRRPPSRPRVSFTPRLEPGRAVVRCRCGDVFFADQRAAHNCGAMAAGGAR